MGHSVGVVRRLLLETLVLELYLLNKCLVHVVWVDLDHARLLPVGQEVFLQLVLSNLVLKHVEKLVVSLLQNSPPADSLVLMTGLILQQVPSIPVQLKLLDPQLRVAFSTSCSGCGRLGFIVILLLRHVVGTHEFTHHDGLRACGVCT